MLLGGRQCRCQLGPPRGTSRFWVSISVRQTSRVGIDPTIFRWRGENRVRGPTIRGTLGFHGPNRLDMESVFARRVKSRPRSIECEWAQRGGCFGFGISGYGCGGGRVRPVAGLAKKILQLVEKIRERSNVDRVSKHDPCVLCFPGFARGLSVNFTN